MESYKTTYNDIGEWGIKFFTQWPNCIVIITGQRTVEKMKPLENGELSSKQDAINSENQRSIKKASIRIKLEHVENGLLSSPRLHNCMAITGTVKVKLWAKGTWARRVGNLFSMVCMAIFTMHFQSPCDLSLTHILHAFKNHLLKIQFSIVFSYLVFF